MWLEETLIFIDFLESAERYREMHAAPPRPSPIPPWASVSFKCTKQGEAGGNSPSSILNAQCQGERTPSDLLPKRWDQESYYLQKPEDEHSPAVSPQ